MRNVFASPSNVVIRFFCENSRFQGNYVGIDVSGQFKTTAVTTGTRWYHGIQISGDNNLIGGSDPGAGNVVSGNYGDGIAIYGSTDIIIQGNKIGTDASGNFALPNESRGLVTHHQNLARDIWIGGTEPGSGNLISGNKESGIELSGSGHIVQGNIIGADISGTAMIENGNNGINLNGLHVTIGGNTPGAGNLISGNGRNGIFIGGYNNIIEGNLIGTDITGLLDLGNKGSGIYIDRDENIIGGSRIEARNIISGNDGNGVVCQGWYNLIQGNFIGTDITGLNPLGNRGSGLFFDNAGSHNIVGGSTPGKRNVISGNGSIGINIQSANFNIPCSNNTIIGNYIGADATGINPLGNTGHGVRFATNSIQNILGGYSAGESNIIAYNSRNGIHIEHGRFPTYGNTIIANSIFSNDELGIDLYPNGVTPNDSGDTDSGSNNLQNFPIITSAGNVGAYSIIEGELNSIPNTSFMIQFYTNTNPDPSGYGEGENYIGSIDATTDETGNVGFTATFPASIPLGSFVTATATDPAGNTSEFSGEEEVTILDSDGDGIYDLDDNCVDVPNPDQSDIDFDGEGDVCDEELDVCGAGDGLIGEIVELNLHANLENAFITKIDGACESCEHGNAIAAINKIGAFINQVNAKRAKVLTDTEADALITFAQALIDGIENGDNTCGNETAMIANYIPRKIFPSEKLDGIQITPNPFSKDFSISFSLDQSEAATINIYTLSGRKITSKVVDLQKSRFLEIRLDENKLNDGIYLLQVIMDSGEVTTKKIVRSLR